MKLPTIWTTREGEEIPIKDLRNDHLKNCIRMVQRDRLWEISTEWRMLLKALVKEWDRRELVGVFVYEVEPRQRVQTVPVKKAQPKRKKAKWVIVERGKVKDE